MEFKISSFCSIGDCVEVGADDEQVVVRDTKKATGGKTIEMTRAQWNTFVAAIKNGDGDRFLEAPKP